MLSGLLARSLSLAPKESGSAQQISGHAGGWQRLLPRTLGPLHPDCVPKSKGWIHSLRWSRYPASGRLSRQVIKACGILELNKCRDHLCLLESPCGSVLSRFSEIPFEPKTLPPEKLSAAGSATCVQPSGWTHRQSGSGKPP